MYVASFVSTIFSVLKTFEILNSLHTDLDLMYFQPLPQSLIVFPVFYLQKLKREKLVPLFSTRH